MSAIPQEFPSIHYEGYPGMDSQSGSITFAATLLLATNLPASWKDGLRGSTSNPFHLEMAQPAAATEGEFQAIQLT
jgi:hypothetical protein